MAGTPIIVPVHLDAICVGQQDAQKRHNQFAPPLYDFTFLDTQNYATQFTSDRLDVQHFGTASAKPAGVYLHWGLPTTLTNGRLTYRITCEVLNSLRHQGFPESIIKQLETLKDPYDTLKAFQEAIRIPVQIGLGGNSVTDVETDWHVSWAQAAASHMTFPHLPNRWLVVRIRTDDQSRPYKAWLIESDFVAKTNLYAEKDSQFIPSATIPWPFTSGDGGSPEDAALPYYRYLGRVRALDEAWPVDAVEERVSDLTAIGYGKAAFAAYLPHCQNVFGHYDALKDVQCPASLLYVVVGWFAEGDKDPFNSSLGPDEIKRLLTEHKWTLPNLDVSEEVLRSIEGTFYSGTLLDVQWNPTHEYVRQVILNPDEVSVCLGHGETEALAVYLGQGKTSAGPMTPEEKIEALQLGILKTIQTSPEPEIALEQELHTSGFHAEDGGSIWNIARRSWGDTADSAANQFDQKLAAAGSAPLHLPPEIGAELSELNTLQRLFDTLQFFNQAQRREIFFRWYYFLRWSYGHGSGTGQKKHQASELKKHLLQLTTDSPPTADELAYAKPPLLAKALGELAQLEVKGDQIVNQPVQNLPFLEQALGELAQRMVKLAAAIATQLASLGAGYQLRVERAPRFFQPNEPHLVVVDKTSQVSSRFPTSGTIHHGVLFCRRLNQLIASGDTATMRMLSRDSDKGQQLTEDQLYAINIILGEAMTTFTIGQSSLIPEAQLSETQYWAPAARALTIWGDQLAGQAISSDSVSRANPWHPILMQWQVRFRGLPREKDYGVNFITAKIDLDQDGIDLCDICDESTQKEDTDNSGTSYEGTIVLSRRASMTLRNQLERHLQQADDPELRGWNLTANLDGILSQALGGFNDALTTCLRDVQLAVFDPYAQTQEKQENLRIRAAIGRHNDYTPKNLYQYNPIRAGYLKVEKIRLVDVFGQYRTIENINLLLPKRLAQTSTGEIKLPPRLVQPSRLLFRWKSAAGDQAEMNSHKDTSPICGWVVSNCLDNSLMIYAQDGIYLGAIREGTAEWPQWENAPGMPEPTAPDYIPQDIPNPELSRFVTGLLKDTRENFALFCDKIERVLTIIEPENDPQQNALAVLMGRPLALVQAVLALELKGPPVCRLNNDSFFEYESTGRLDDDNFPDVQFPVRLGDLSRGSDGLVGYFKSSAGSEIEYNSSTFQAENEAANILLASYDRVLVTMLVDPRASVHATSGILPVKTIDIPPAQYADSLRQMVFTFVVNPVLSPDRLRLPLPAESDKSWAWLSRSDQETWQNPNTSVGKIADWAGYRQDERLRLIEGWLQVNPLTINEETKKNGPEEI